jgi:hypothetical protein
MFLGKLVGKSTTNMENHMENHWNYMGAFQPLSQSPGDRH